MSFPNEFISHSATVIIRPKRLRVHGRSTVHVHLTFRKPTGLDAIRLPIYSGYIVIRSSAHETFHVPYAGAACNMKRITLIDFRNGFPFISRSFDAFDNSSSRIRENDTIVFPGDIVFIHWRLVMGSALVRVDVLSHGETLTSNRSQMLGSIDTFPRLWNSRDTTGPSGALQTQTNFWFGRLNTNVTVGPGYYQLVYRALKIFGNRENDDDYETWFSPRFRVIFQSNSTA